ncbi:hypothetical protein BS47DRAFT_1347710 [Hydnum rufescens UP504]|uniref:Uncharacterized protein n=1 Tax=Hydnum rufescens UP504 TaxID=1448309 RepID=A0A9P6ARG2_9AGAM|nr:hypothetical protein BS47DRAFT_1347710 [Hydnum rufescens UP504]
MYVDAPCCVPYRCKFGHIFMPWALRRSHGHHLKSSDTILAKHVDVIPFFILRTGRVILPLRRPPRKNELHSPLPLRALMLERVRSKS